MRLKIMTWNIQGAASLVWNNQYKIKKDVVDKIICPKPKEDIEADIIVLTEYVIAQGIDYLLDKFKEKGYIWMQQSRTGENGILIAIKAELVNQTLLKDEIYKSNIIQSNIQDCNLLEITFPLKNNKNICILGCRLATGEKELKQNYDEERKAFDEILLKYVNNMKQQELCIICGDFNNARCLGNLNQKYNREDYKDKAQINYNLNYIKDTFDGLGYQMADCKEGNPIPTYKGYIPDDHIFVKGLSIENCDTVGTENLSAHDIIIAECDIK